MRLTGWRLRLVARLLTCRGLGPILSRLAAWHLALPLGRALAAVPAPAPAPLEVTSPCALPLR
jgi:hypothetical protein